MEHEGDGAANCNWHGRYSHQRISKGTGGLANKSIVKIGQNTEKSRENLRIFAVS